MYWQGPSRKFSLIDTFMHRYIFLIFIRRQIFSVLSLRLVKYECFRYFSTAKNSLFASLNCTLQWKIAIVKFVDCKEVASLQKYCNLLRSCYEVTFMVNLMWYNTLYIHAFILCICSKAIFSGLLKYGLIIHVCIDLFSTFQTLPNLYFS